MKFCDSFYGYKNVIKSDIIIDLLKQKGYYIPRSLEKSENLKKFVDEISNEGPIFNYEDYVDFTELIEAIKKSRFHNDNNLNTLFQIRAINYIINGDSLIHILIHEIIKLISNIDSTKLKNLFFYIKVYNENDITSSLNTSRIVTSNNENNNFIKNQDEHLNSKNIEIKDPFKNSKKQVKKFKLKLKSDITKKPLKSDNNKNIIINKDIYNNKEITYRFHGLPIYGYKGYIPQQKFFYSISNSKIMKIVYNNGLYLTNLEKEKNENILKRRKNMEKIIIDCEERPLIKKDIKKRFIITQRNNIINNIDYSYNIKKIDFPNIFDSLFSIRKIGSNIEVIQNDISELLKPYLEKEKFELLANYNFPSKTITDLPESWKNYLNLTNIYPSFGLNKLQEDNTKDGNVGIIKLHKGY